MVKDCPARHLKPRRMGELFERERAGKHIQISVCGGDFAGGNGLLLGGSGNGSGRIGSGSKDNRRIFTGESVFKNILLPGFIQLCPGIIRFCILI